MQWYNAIKQNDISCTYQAADFKVDMCNLLLTKQHVQVTSVSTEEMHTIVQHLAVYQHHCYV